jgi:uncharacterized protein YlaI
MERLKPQKCILCLKRCFACDRMEAIADRTVNFEREWQKPFVVGHQAYP